MVSLILTLTVTFSMDKRLQDRCLISKMNAPAPTPTFSSFLGHGAVLKRRLVVHLLASDT
jgi:hypothetical protein